MSLLHRTTQIVAATATLLCICFVSSAHAQWPFGKNDNRAFRAIDSNNVDGLKTLLSEKQSLLNKVNSYLQTPLIYAISRSKPAMVRVLLESGADINRIDGNHKKSPLHWAITYRKPEIAELLLEYSPDLSIRDSADSTPLELAIGYGFDGKVLETLIEKSDLGSKNKAGANCLYTACWNKRWEVANLLIDKMRTEDLNGPDLASPINIAYTFDGEQTVKKLLDRECKIPKHVNHMSETILMWAIRKGNFEIVNKLLLRDVSLSPADNNSAEPLLGAIHHRAENVIPLLIQHGAKVNIKEPSSQALDAVSLAIQNKLTAKTIELLIRNYENFDPNSGSRYASYLSDAATSGSRETVDVLLDAGADINRVEPNYSPLMAAAMNGHVELFDYLIKKRADRSLVATDGTTLFPFVCQSGNFEFVKREIKTTNDINKPNHSGATPFYAAAFTSSAKEICDLLIRHGAKTNRVNMQGQGMYPTPLHTITRQCIM